MATKPTLNLPEWASTEPVGTNVIEPTSRKTTGYTKNLQGIPEKPTYQELNFLLKSNYEWTQYLEDATDAINYITVTAGEALTANDVVRLSGGLAYKADNTTEGGITAVVGIVTQTTAINDPAIIAVRYWNGFSGLTAGETYYVGTTGGLTTQSFNSTVSRPLIVGTGITSSLLLINIKEHQNYKQYNSYKKSVLAATPTPMVSVQINAGGYTEGIIKIQSIRHGGTNNAEAIEKAYIVKGFSGDFQILSTVNIIPEDATFYNRITTSITSGVCTFSVEVAHNNDMVFVINSTLSADLIITNL